MPAPIELKLEANQNIEQIWLFGLGCPQPIALTNLSKSAVALSAEALKESLEKTRVKVNKELHNYQKVDKIIVLKENWTVDNGMLTPTFKVKRNELNKKFEKKLIVWQNSVKSIIIT